MATSKPVWTSEVVKAFAWDGHKIVDDLMLYKGRPPRTMVFAARLSTFVQYYIPIFTELAKFQLPPSKQAAQLAQQDLDDALGYLAQIFEAIGTTLRDRIPESAQSESDLHRKVTVDQRAILALNRVTKDIVAITNRLIGQIGDIRVHLPATWTGRLEGFQVLVTFSLPGASEDQRDQIEAVYDEIVMPELQRALRGYRQRVEAAFPWLARNTLPIEFFIGPSQSRFIRPGVAGMYDGDRVQIYLASNRTGELPMIATLAHEMGHHVYRVYLGGAARGVWHEFRDWQASDGARELSLVKLRRVWTSMVIDPMEHTYDPETLHVQGFFDELEYLDDPHAIQTAAALEALIAAGAPIRSLLDLDALVRRGVDVVPIPGEPITGYAETNSEEAFCEAFGLLVAYGPRRLTPLTRVMMRRILPEFRWQLAPPLQGLL